MLCETAATQRNKERKMCDSKLLYLPAGSESSVVSREVETKKKKLVWNVVARAPVICGFKFARQRRVVVGNSLG